MEELGDKDICFGPVNTLGETFADLQLRHRGMIVEMEGASGRTVVVGNPIKLSDTPGGVRTPPPQFGEHTDGVLRSLGFGAEQIAALRRQGLV